MPTSPTPPVALERAYSLTLRLIAKTNSLPRSHRFTLGDRIYALSLDLVTSLTQATFSHDKSRTLETASERVNSLRILLRLAQDLKLLSFDSYVHATTSLDEIGRMIGGWRKAR
ncbi:MAG: diversity-generating retroelement protein Avd [Bryobacterales bacterium]|nr:diversity-generating retroelement protein Avd [Bryobacterales bacterium]